MTNKTQSLVNVIKGITAELITAFPDEKDSLQGRLEKAVYGLEEHLIESEIIPKQPKFPIKAVVYLHSSKESMYDIGEGLGLPEEALSKFMYCCYEVKINIEVNEDGTYKILNCGE